MEPQDERELFDLTPQEADLHAALASAQAAQRLAENLVSVGRALYGNAGPGAGPRSCLGISVQDG